MYSSNKDYFNKSQTIVEHGVSKTFYPNVTMTEEEKESAKLQRDAWRNKMTSYILDCDPKTFFKHFPAVIVFNSDDKFEWFKEKLEMDDDISLTFKYTICKNYNENHGINVEN